MAVFQRCIKVFKAFKVNEEQLQIIANSHDSVMAIYYSEMWERQYQLRNLLKN